MYRMDACKTFGVRIEEERKGVYSTYSTCTPTLRCIPLPPDPPVVIHPRGLPAPVRPVGETYLPLSSLPAMTRPDKNPHKFAITTK